MSDEKYKYPFHTESDLNTVFPALRDQLLNDRLVAYPTETVYGFGGRVTRTAIDNLSQLKVRDAAKTFLVLISDIEMLEQIDCRMTPVAERLIAAFWPGPLTIVFPPRNQSADNADNLLRGPGNGIAVRLTSHILLRKLIRRLGFPITSTSANHNGTPPAISAQEVMAEWPQALHDNRLIILDGGTLPSASPSSVVDCTTSPTAVLRTGSIGMSELSQVVPDLVKR